MINVERHNCDGAMRFVAMDADKKAGYAYAYLKKSQVGVGYIKNSSEIRGVGTLLMNAIIDWSLEVGAVEITGTVIPEPGTTQALFRVYEKCGFEVDKKRGIVTKKLKQEEF